MASLRKLAAELGVSVATVSRALNHKPNVNAATRERVLVAARGAGYMLPATSRGTSVIALAYPRGVVRADYGSFDTALLAGVMRGVSDKRFDVLILDIQRDKLPRETYTSFFTRKNVQGAILRCFDDSRQLCEDIASEGFPSVVVAERFDDPNVNFICSESRWDSRRAVEHLIQLGHRRIALGVHQIRDTDHRDRCDGYREALTQHGLTYDPALVVDLVADIRGGANAVRYLLSLRDPPTAIFFTDPLATIGALHHCREMGVTVPDELSIVGFDDSDVRHHAFPPFTAVCQDASELGFEAGRWLARRVSGETTEPLRVMRQTFFEINQTTAPPARGRQAPGAPPANMDGR